MASGDLNFIFDAAIRIMLTVDKSISIRFTEHAINVKLPTTRQLADFLEMPHYYVLPYLGMMEKEELVTRVERVGIHTTAKGSKALIDLMSQHHREQVQTLLGRTIFDEIQRRADESEKANQG
ncbi:MAG: hypothetical protein ACXVIT_11600 [Halobacteriota archaeon]